MKLSEITSTYPTEVVLAVKRDMPHQIGMEVENMRMKAGLTQKQLAKKIGTLQPAIARIESGSYLPSLTMMNKIAKVLGTYWKFELVEGITDTKR